MVDVLYMVWAVTTVITILSFLLSCWLALRFTKAFWEQQAQRRLIFSISRKQDELKEVLQHINAKPEPVLEERYSPHTGLLSRRDQIWLMQGQLGLRYDD